MNLSNASAKRSSFGMEANATSTVLLSTILLLMPSPSNSVHVSVPSSGMPLAYSASIHLTRVTTTTMAIGTNTTEQRE